MRYEVNSRYTSRTALREKLQIIFPYTRTADFDIKLINDTFCFTVPRALSYDEEK
ncbi:hypothetical protein N7G274_009937 [Stereocaulon virgatum]|uniref:Uncharacterized protein n=1 Tax=Stereocaulon virgatum TaxID=373712 RepID=A0ABR3ZWW7_9LECA